MQTLISVFDNPALARQAVDRLVEAGFAYGDIELKETDTGREAPVDRGVLDSIGHFFVSLFGDDDGRATAGAYRKSVERGHSIVVVDARDDQEAENAAVILHETGAIDVDDRDAGGGAPAKPGVRAYRRDSGPKLRDLAKQRNLREESLLAERPK